MKKFWDKVFDWYMPEFIIVIIVFICIIIAIIVSRPAYSRRDIVYIHLNAKPFLEKSGFTVVNLTQNKADCKKI